MNYLKLNPARKGYVAENLVANDLITSNYFISRPAVDDSGIDFIITKDMSNYITIQVKNTSKTRNNDAVFVDVKPARFKPDYIAVCSEHFDNKIAYIPNDKSKKRFNINIRIKPTSELNKHNVKYLNQYLQKPKLLNKKHYSEIYESSFTDILDK